MKKVHVVLLLCVGFGAGLLVDRGAAAVIRTAKAEGPQAEATDDDVRVTLRQHTAQIKDLQEQHVRMQKHLGKLESPNQ